MLRLDMLRKAVLIGFQKLKMGVEDNMAALGVLKLKGYKKGAGVGYLAFYYFLEGLELEAVLLIGG